MKKFLCIFLLLLLPFSSCAKTEEYRDDVACRPLTTKLAELCPVENGYSELGDEQLKYFFEGTDLPTDYSMIGSNDMEDINEIGIFHCKNKEDAEKMLELTKKYIENMQATQVNFISSYAPYEIPKLEGADVRRYGNYVVYVILDTNEQKTAFSAIENELVNVK